MFGHVLLQVCAKMQVGEFEQRVGAIVGLEQIGLQQLKSDLSLW